VKAVRPVIASNGVPYLQLTASLTEWTGCMTIIHKVEGSMPGTSTLSNVD
jgi:hypothetical protein